MCWRIFIYDRAQSTKGSQVAGGIRLSMAWFSCGKELSSSLGVTPRELVSTFAFSSFLDPTSDLSPCSPREKRLRGFQILWVFNEKELHQYAMQPRERYVTSLLHALRMYQDEASNYSCLFEMENASLEERLAEDSVKNMYIMQAERFRRFVISEIRNASITSSIENRE